MHTKFWSKNLQGRVDDRLMLKWILSEAVDWIILAFDLTVKLRTSIFIPDTDL